MDKFTPYLIQFSQMLTSLTESGLPSHISVSSILLFAAKWSSLQLTD